MCADSDRPPRARVRGLEGSRIREVANDGLGRSDIAHGAADKDWAALASVALRRAGLDG